MGNLRSNRCAIFLALAVVVALCLPQAATAAQGPFFGEWSLSGSPYSIATQSTDTVWATLPAQNAIARLQVSPQGAPTVTLYPVPTANAEPYGIAFGDNAVWFTERLGNKIGRLDPASGAIVELAIPTANSQPTGIAVLPGPGLAAGVWFAERSGNALGRLVVTSTVPPTGAFTEYPLPWANSQPEDVAAAEDTVWFTAPGSSRIGLLRPALWPSSTALYGIGAGVNSQPWAISLVPGMGGYPWLTERATDRVGVYMPQTFSDIRWFTPPTPASDPYDIAAYWYWAAFVERAADRVGFLNSRTGAIREFRLPGSAPTSIAFDANGCAWVAENGANKIARLCPPYFNFVFTPAIRR